MCVCVCVNTLYENIKMSYNTVKKKTILFARVTLKVAILLSCMLMFSFFLA